MFLVLKLSRVQNLHKNSRLSFKNSEYMSFTIIIFFKNGFSQNIVLKIKIFPLKIHHIQFLINLLKSYYSNLNISRKIALRKQSIHSLYPRITLVQRSINIHTFIILVSNFKLMVNYSLWCRVSFRISFRTAIVIVYKI